MNPTLWKVLLGTTLGAAATDEAEAAWIGPHGLQKVGDVGYDMLESVRTAAGRAAAKSNPAALLPFHEMKFNKTLWNQGLYGVKPKQYMFDDAGNLRKWSTNHWTDDELLTVARQALAPNAKYGPRNQFRLDEIMDENSLAARAYPEIWRNTTAKFVDSLPGNVGGTALYDPVTGGGTISLNRRVYKDIDNPRTQRGLINVMEHELNHMISGYEGLQGGASSDWFSKLIPANTGRTPLQNSPDILYLDALDERLARSAGMARGDNVDPFNTLADISQKSNRPAWIPEQSKTAQGKMPWSNVQYGSPYPHELNKAAHHSQGDPDIFKKLVSAPTEIAKGFVSDPGTYVGLIPKLGGLGPALGMWASDLGNGEQLPEGELAKQLGLIGAITGGGF